MNKPLPRKAARVQHNVRTTRAEAVRELEQEVINLFTGSEKALLLAEDLVEKYFCPFSEAVGDERRKASILHYFEQNRVRAEILHDVPYNMKTTAEALNAELRKSAKGA